VTASEYRQFIDRKAQLGSDDGFEPLWIPDWLFDFQKHLVEWAIRKGRAAIFADCGLGKTPMQLVWAANVVRKTHKPVLILTPLAVSHQTEREANKFDIGAERSSNGNVSAPIVITNYERLHYFDQADFGGVVCDECFPPDTEVDTLDPLDNTLTQVYIKDILPGNRIVNASGVDHVKHTRKRPIKRAVRIHAEHGDFICSENHPFFTLHGWTCATDLRPTDYLMATGEAMRLVRSDIQSHVLGLEMEPVLRKILLSEMANEPPETQSQGTHAGDVHQDTSGTQEVEGVIDGSRQGGVAGDIAKGQPFIGTVGEGEDQQAAEGNRSQANRTGGERSVVDRTAASVAGPATEHMDCGVCHNTREEATRFSELLQSGHRQPNPEDSDRMRRTLSSRTTKSNRPEEGRKACFSRVVSVEVLELGHPDLDRYRDADGHVYFYDIEATRHPSFSVQGVLVHNSSILKNYSGRRKAEITEFCREVPYRSLCTATAAPNDFWELGTSSEALGYLGHQDMLGKFFKQDTSKDHLGWGRTTYRFRGHAEQQFWQWVCSWARVCRKPSDLGFDDGEFTLPPLIETEHVISSSTPRSGMLFSTPARSLPEQREERRNTIKERCEAVAENVANHDGASVCWCHLNQEGDMLAKMIPNAMQVKGTQPDELKEERLLAFQAGEIPVLVTKPKIGCFGLNWQHCHNVVTFPSHSWEQYYQSIRRCLRFGQKNPVKVTVVTTEGERGVMSNLQRKARQADLMFDALCASANDALHIDGSHSFNQLEEVPPWL